MFKRLASIVVVVALVCAVSGTAAFAKQLQNPDEKTDVAKAPAKVPAKEESKATAQLRSKMLKLVDDVKAGKNAPAPKWQGQPTKSNNWSKKTKIAIGVGAAVTVVVLILVVNHARNHFFDGAHPFCNSCN
jgi:uncharacterized protein YcnI